MVLRGVEQGLAEHVGRSVELTLGRLKLRFHTRDGFIDALLGFLGER